MSKSAFRILAVFTLIAVIAATWAIRQEWSRWGSNEHGTRIFPELASNLDSVSRLKLRHRDTTITLERRPNGWVLLESDGFPARSKSIQELLFALSETRRLEPKTQEPARYARLQVEDPKEPAANSIGVEVFADDGSPLASLILGKENLLLQAIGEGGAYLRLPGQKKVWLASGNLVAKAEPKDWLDNPIIDIRRQRFAKATIAHPNGDILIVRNAGKDKGGFILDGLEANEKLISDFYPTDIARLWEKFEVHGARKRDAVSFPENASIKGRYETADGLIVAFELATVDGKDWLLINSATTDNSQSPEAVAEAKAFADRTRDFVFEIPEFESIHLKKNRAQVVQKTKPQS